MNSNNKKICVNTGLVNRFPEEKGFLEYKKETTYIKWPLEMK